MKSNIFCMLAFIAMVAAGCNKDFVQNDEVQTVQLNAAADGSALSVAKVSVKKKSVTRYCALIGPPDSAADSYGFIMNVAGELGVSYLRDKAPVPGVKKVQTLTSGYKVLLNFSGTSPMPMRFRTDTAAYKKDLTNVLSAFTIMPAVAVIENEESNSGFYSGTALEYITQLRAAINIMHSYHIPVANGGITSTGLTYLVYEDLVSRGLTDEAAAYKSYIGINLGSPATIDRGDFVSVLLSNFAVMKLDYVNFHWHVKGPDDSTYLGETIAYLKKTTHKKIITNELGQYTEDPESVTSALQTCKNYKLPYVAWYSCFDTRFYPLQYINQALTESGVSFKNFIAK